MIAFFAAVLLSLHSPARADGPGIVCVPAREGYRLVRESDGVVFGKPLSRAECGLSVAAAADGVVCARADISGDKSWKAVSVAHGHWLGRYAVPAEDCFEATRHARGGVVCGHTGLVLDGGKLGWKPTFTAKPDDKGFLGSSAWLDFCKVATLHAREGQACANGNGGTGDHRYWYRQWIATAGLVDGARPGTVFECSK